MKPALPYVKKYRDRHGTLRYYYRRKGWPTVALPSPLTDMRAFLDAYAVAEGKAPARVPESRTMEALIAAYMASPEFRALKPASRELYLYAIRWLRKRPSMALPVAAVTRDQIRTMRDELAEDTPGKANAVLRFVRLLMSYAVERGWRVENPALKLKTIKGGEHRSWTDAELLKFEERWPRGTTERLIYELALGTGQRRGDIAKMTWADIKNGKVYVCQEKTGAKLWIRCHPSLSDELGRTAKRHSVIVSTPTGRGYTADYLGVSFAGAIDAAGLPEACVLHGLRKTAARRLAEAGCSERQIMAVTGHKSAKEVDRYTRDADQEVQADAAIQKRIEHEIRSTRVYPFKKGE